jgi:predicted alpha-1,6-mannanase (GH76 family)
MKITRNTQGVKGPTKGIYIDSKQYPYCQGQKLGYQMKKNLALRKGFKGIA